jgi:DHA1 family purine ribonucleoside efflux pump-like MFS transporter
LLGVFGVIGTYLIGSLLQHRMYVYLISIPLLMAVVAALMIAFGGSTFAVGLLLAAWGVVATPAPVAWGLWLSKTLPDDAEAGGGLMVATIQMAITMGAGLGGFMFDAMGWWSPFAFGTTVLVGSAAFAWGALRNSTSG